MDATGGRHSNGLNLKTPTSKEMQRQKYLVLLCKALGIGTIENVVV